MSSCIYAGSFDCFHNGHANIVRRALKAFDLVLILVANNPKKKYTLDISQRLDIINRHINQIWSPIHSYSKIVVNVLPDTRLVSDYAREAGIESILKGIRNIQDTEYEKMLHEITVSQENGIDTFVLFSDPNDQKISSSAIKELIKYNADVRDYIPLYTKQQMEVTQNKQHIIGVTGGIGCGKSTITDLFSKIKNLNMPVINVDMDIISHRLTYGVEYDKNQEVIELRNKTRELLDMMVVSSGQHIHDDLLRKKLKERIFTDEQFRNTLNNLYKPVMIREIRKQISGKQGLIIINGALLVDLDMQYLCNNNVVMVTAPPHEIHERLNKRGHTQTEIDLRRDAQLKLVKKYYNLNKSIKKDNHGKICVIMNSIENGWDISKSIDDRTTLLDGVLKTSGFWKAIDIER